MHPAFERAAIEPPTPLVVEVPHGGLALDDATRQRIPADALAAGAVLADSDVGAVEVFRRASLGRAATVVATESRYVLDLNTEPRMPTAYEDKLPPGLGDVRRISQCGARWVEPRRTAADLHHLVTTRLEPYHRAIEEELDRAAARHRAVLLVSGHTFPSVSGSAPDVVIGTRHGATAPAELRDAIATALRDAGLAVALETPFPGGYSVTRHARPREGRHALQIEIARHLVASPGAGYQVDEGAAQALADAVAAGFDAAGRLLAGTTPTEAPAPNG